MYNRNFTIGFGGGLTPIVKNIIIVNAAIFILQMLPIQLGNNGINFTYLFALNYQNVVDNYMFWQVFTYMFLHGNFWHILFNMLFLFFFASELEQKWGSKRFLRYYFFTGVSAGFCILLIDWLSLVLAQPSLATVVSPTTLGASGAVLGVLVAYALYFPDRQITLLLFFILPITLKTKHFVLGYALIELFSLISGSQKSISNSGHLGGMLSAIIFFRLFRKHTIYNQPNSTIDYFFLSIRNFFQWNKKNIYRKNDKDNPFSFYKKKTKNFASNNISGLDETKMTDEEIEKKIDDLLDVITDKGVKALKVEEQFFLDRVSKLYRHKFPD